MTSDHRMAGDLSPAPSFNRYILAVTLAAAACAHAQPAWKPEKAVEIVIGTSAGGPQDRMGRTIQRILQEHKLVATPLAVVNKPGGGGAIALSYLNQHAGDGHYLAVNALSTLTNHITGKSALGPGDLTPIAMMGAEYVGVTVRTDSPVKSGKDLIERLRKDPASLSIAVGTTLGNATHLSLVLAMKAAGVDIRKLKTVVFNSGGETMTAVLGGHIDVAVSAPSSVLPQVQAGKMRMLAVGAPQRMGGEFAQVPTWKELGINSSFELWRGLAGPKGMSREQIQFWDAALGALVKTEEWKKELADNRIENIYKNSADTGRQWKAEYDEVKGVLIELGLAK
jgi:putative tricarboxylic transport membrane protein